MEFKLINPKNENGFIQAIEFNFEELKAELSTRLENYNKPFGYLIAVIFVV